MTTSRALLVSTLALLGACGGDEDDGGSSSGTLTPGEAEVVCEDGCTYAVECGWESSQAECEAECEGWADDFRGDLIDYVVECQAELECSDNPIICWEQAEDDLPQTSAQESFEQACEDRTTDCVGEGGEGCDADLYWAASDEVMRDLEACLEEPCTEIRACMLDVWDLL